MIKIFLSFFVFFQITYAQTVKGLIQDSLKIPLPYTNVIATNINSNKVSAFSIADEKGYYEFKLKNNQTYSVEVSLMGYATYYDTITVSKKKIN